MENNKIKIIFLGTPGFGAVILEKLCQSQFRPVLVITEPDKPVGRKQVITSPPVKLLAEKYKIPLEQPERIQDTRYKIQDTKPDLIIVAAYGQIIPKNILAIPKYGCLNIHPSLLPKYRGATPVQSAILNGNRETGVTIIKMTEKVDAGDIVAISNLKSQISKLTYEQLHDKLAELGTELLVKTIPDWLAGKIKPVPQDETKATYAKIFKKEDGLLDWKKPADYIERQVRALNPWPGTYTFYNGKMLKILKAEIADNKLLIKEVQPAGKKPMPFEDFLRGHKDFKIPC